MFFRLGSSNAQRSEVTCFLFRLSTSSDISIEIISDTGIGTALVLD